MVTTLYAYIDETGDLGDIASSPKASRMFGMAGVICDETGAAALRQLIAELKAEFNVPHDKNFSWKAHVRPHERRKYIAQRLASLEHVQVIYVFTDKTQVRGNYVHNRGYLYNYVAGKMFRNLLYAASHWGVPDPKITIRFSHVKGFDHKQTSYPYMMTKLPAAQDGLPMHLVEGLSWVDARKYRESDVADLFAGCLNAAITRDQFGNVEGAYLMTVWEKIRMASQCQNDGQYCAIPLGIMPMPHYEVMKSFGWFRCQGCNQVQRKSGQEPPGVDPLKECDG